MSRSVSDFAPATGDVVRVLPKGVRSMDSKHYRIICSCQVHAMRERKLWRRSLRAARRVASSMHRGSIALIVGLPLAFGAIGIPMNAMDTPLLAIRSFRHTLPFVTPKAAASFGAPALPPRQFTFDAMKEEFFRTNVPYGQIIYREARRNELPPELVAAVVEAESDFRPRLISQKNAQGLMQIIPETGRLMGAEDLFDPQENIAAGTKYLRYLIDRFGDQSVALAAYNAGEGNIEKFGGMPPFGETKAYVQRVTARTAQYRESVRGHFVTAARLMSAQ